MRKLLTITLLAALLALPLTASVEAQSPSRFGGTITYGTWLQSGFRATTATTAGADVVIMTDDSARQRIISRTGYLGVARDSGEVQGFFEVVMLQRYIKLGGRVDVYAQSGLGGFNQVVIDGDDERYVLGVFELGINIWSVISVGAGSHVIFKDEGTQFNLYAKFDFLRAPL